MSDQVIMPAALPSFDCAVEDKPFSELAFPNADSSQVETVPALHADEVVVSTILRKNGGDYAIIALRKTRPATAPADTPPSMCIYSSHSPKSLRELAALLLETANELDGGRGRQ